MDVVEPGRGYDQCRRNGYGSDCWSYDYFGDAGECERQYNADHSAGALGDHDRFIAERNREHNLHDNLSGERWDCALHLVTRRGALPPGLTLGSTGVIAGTPTTAGTSNLTVRVADASVPAQTATRLFSLTINSAGTSGLIGNTAEGTLTDNLWYNGAWINAGRFQAGSNMVAATMRAKVGATPGKYKCAIYSDVGSQPGRLLGSTAEVSNPVSGWQSFPLTSSVALTKGSYYWLAIWSGDSNARIYYSGNNGTLRWGLYNYGTWPDPISTSGGGNFNYCIYAR